VLGQHRAIAPEDEVRAARAHRFHRPFAERIILERGCCGGREAGVVVIGVARLRLIALLDRRAGAVGAVFSLGDNSILGNP
jgi:hypothetical protein